MTTHALACAFVIAVVGPATAAARQHPAMPPGMTHEQHLAEMEKESDVKQRGAAAMGFDQDATRHHFRLLADGGAIEVVTRNAADILSRDQIRTHLQQIAAEFAAGNFAKPFATHGEVPPGVATMQARTAALRFGYEDRPNGGIVRIRTSDAQARAAVHAFLRYQIREHATGDATTVAK